MDELSDANEPLFELRDVGLRRGDVTVFESLDLTIRSGAQTAILGPNGAGKSSLVQLLTRDLYPLHRPQTVLRILGRDRWPHLGAQAADRHRQCGPRSAASPARGRGAHVSAHRTRDRRGPASKELSAVPATTSATPSTKREASKRSRPSALRDFGTVSSTRCRAVSSDAFCSLVLSCTDRTRSSSTNRRPVSI